MAALPVVPLSKDALERRTRKELILHIYSCYRRQDVLDDHETLLRVKTSQHTLPVREAPVARQDDHVLMNADLSFVMEHILHLQRRLDEYLVTFHDIYKAVDSLSTRSYQRAGVYRKGVSREDFLTRRAELRRLRYQTNKVKKVADAIQAPGSEVKVAV